MKRGSPKRDWDAANEKRPEGCRVCGRYNVELAHTIKRAAQDKPKRPGSKTLWVNPDSVVPLCPRHHQAYDAHELDLQGFLTLPEQLDAVEAAGSIETARVRLSPSSYRNQTNGEAALVGSDERSHE